MTAAADRHNKGLAVDLSMFSLVAQSVGSPVLTVAIPTLGKLLRSIMVSCKWHGSARIPHLHHPAEGYNPKQHSRCEATVCPENNRS